MGAKIPRSRYETLACRRINKPRKRQTQPITILENEAVEEEEGDEGQRA
jgi:hypothetical protein